MVTQNQRFRWTFSKVQEIASQFNSKIEFKTKANRAYQAAHKYGWLSEVSSHMTPLHCTWSEELIRNEALKYISRNKFKVGSQTAYASAIRKNILEEVCTHMIPVIKFWKKDEVKQEALKYKHINDFKKGNSKAYKAAHHNGWFDDVCSHMTRKVRWDFNTVKEEAKLYNSREDFSRGSPGAYGAAKIKRWLDDVCGHMNRLLRSDSNTVYVWNIPGTDICKIGVTSQRLGELRIIEVAKKMGTEYKIILIKHTQSALKLENTLLKLFNEKVKLPVFTGSTEFRIIPLHHRCELQNIIRCYQ